MQNRKRRGNSRYYLFFMLILITIFGVGYGIYTLLSHVSWFNMKSVQITGNVSVADSLIYKIVNPYMGHNLISLPKSTIKKGILRYARIKEVKIHRRLLNKLDIEINERKGFLYLRSLEGDLFPIDENGIVLEKYGNIYRENLPIMSVILNSSRFKPGRRISNQPLNRVLELHKSVLSQAPEFVQNISEYYTIDDVVYMIDARNGMRLIPSRDNLAKQLSRYEFVQDNGNVNNNSVLDLRFNNQVVVKAGK